MCIPIRKADEWEIQELSFTMQGPAIQSALSIHGDKATCQWSIITHIQIFKTERRRKKRLEPTNLGNKSCQALSHVNYKKQQIKELGFRKIGKTKNAAGAMLLIKQTNKQNSKRLRTHLLNDQTLKRQERLSHRDMKLTPKREQRSETYPTQLGAIIKDCVEITEPWCIPLFIFYLNLTIFSIVWFFISQLIKIQVRSGRAAV